MFFFNVFRSREACKNNATSVPVVSAMIAEGKDTVGATTISCERSDDVHAAPLSPIAACSRTSKLTSPGAVPKLIQNEKEDGSKWQKVEYRKKKTRYTFLGEAGKAKTSLSSFKAAEKRMPIFITNIHPETMEADIIDYIKEKTQEKVSLEKINTKKAVDHKAYKFFVAMSKVSLFLDEKIWPEGIIFRRFVHYKNRRAGTMTSADGTASTKYE